MSDHDFDLDRLGDLWRRQPDPAELEELRRAADAARRRARWGQWVDVLAAVGVSAAVLLLVIANPSTDTLLVGGATILILLVSQVRERRLREIEIRSLSGSAEQMLDQSVQRAEAGLKRTRFSLIALGPAIVIGLVLGNLIRARAEQDLLAEILAGRWDRLLVLVVVPAALLLGMAAYLFRAFRRHQQEIGRLTAMRDAYREESEGSSSE